MPSTSHGLFRPWDIEENPARGLNLLAEAVTIRNSGDHDVEMLGAGVEAPPLFGHTAVQLMDVGDNPILSPNDPDMVTEDDLRHIFSDILEIDLGFRNSRQYCRY